MKIASSSLVGLVLRNCEGEGPKPNLSIFSYHSIDEGHQKRHQEKETKSGG